MLHDTWHSRNAISGSPRYITTGGKWTRRTRPVRFGHTALFFCIYEPVTVSPPSRCTVRINSALFLEYKFFTTPNGRRSVYDQCSVVGACTCRSTVLVWITVPNGRTGAEIISHRFNRGVRKKTAKQTKTERGTRTRSFTYVRGLYALTWKWKRISSCWTRNTSSRQVTATVRAHFIRTNDSKIVDGFGPGRVWSA